MIDQTDGPGRKPVQQRSRERLERIVTAAADLIAADGSDQLKMSEVAARAGVSIGSLYQYFPDKASILRTLAERYGAEGRRCIADALAPVRDPESLRAAYLDLVDRYYAIFLAEPVMRDIWSGMQADRQLAAIEIAESRIAGSLLAAAMTRARPGVDPETLAATAFLIWHLGEATMRLAISTTPDEGRALVEAFKQMSVREILAA
ncbi:TetR/AcrR family transcriptional regulator [Caulobacter mirabilis]|uniref:TetR family transcriptional regulator n=1 Tax=Caulobacter mirabilis TaxID=69666 RepID=A0A2D2ASJ1_9CAUL|nr:TetR/AcrR family transcriptional regulator [Caulobacter mirabilis]ATQ40974.1 TetR family transcriptional regulator [Caulobacter mirabilis]